MAVEVILPKVDMDMATGNISAWHARDGDRVQKGQPLFDIETDKAAMEIEAPADGILKLAPLGDGKNIPIGTVVAVIYAEGEEAKAVAPTLATSRGPTTAKTMAATSPQSAETSATGEGRSDGSIRATPLARRLARQAGISLLSLAGTGPRGRITAADLKTASPTQAPALTASSADKAMDLRAAFAAGNTTEIALDGMRRTIAERLTLSKQTVPHFYLTATCTIDTLMALRQRLNSLAPLDADKSPRWKLSINDFIIKSMALALQQVPNANVTFAGTSLLQHQHSDIGVAVSVEGGLFTPVLRQAESKTLSAISLEMKDLAARAQERKLLPSEYQGGSAAISNLGMYGVESFSAIINPPQATILAVGAAMERFVPVDGKAVLATQITITLSCDHRAIDGAVGARLLTAVKRFIEDPALMLV
jgi:pyruvate dehydrogenase E2 component (dihydrolipoamide acetyltransferase)